MVKILLYWKINNQLIILKTTKGLIFGGFTARGFQNSDEKKSDPFQKKMEQLQDSENKDTINESIKDKRKYNFVEFIF